MIETFEMRSKDAALRVRDWSTQDAEEYLKQQLEAIKLSEKPAQKDNNI